MFHASGMEKTLLSVQYVQLGVQDALNTLGKGNTSISFL